MTLPRAIDCQTFNKMRTQRKPHLLLDVREHWEYQLVHLKPSLHMPLTRLGDNLEALSRDIPIVVLCHHGVRSLKACAFLHTAGYENAVSLAGGIDAWSLLADSSIARY